MTGWQLLPGYEHWMYAPDETTAHRLAKAMTDLELAVETVKPTYRDGTDHDWLVIAVDSVHRVFDEVGWRDRVEGVCFGAGGVYDGGQSTAVPAP